VCVKAAIFALSGVIVFIIVLVVVALFSFPSLLELHEIFHVLIVAHFFGISVVFVHVVVRVRLWLRLEGNKRAQVQRKATANAQ
jgi:hypothetical protein